MVFTVYAVRTHRSLSASHWLEVRRRLRIGAIFGLRYNNLKISKLIMLLGSRNANAVVTLRLSYAFLLIGLGVSAFVDVTPCFGVTCVLAGTGGASFGDKSFSILTKSGLSSGS